MQTLEQIKARLELAVPGAKLEIIANESPSAQHSLLVDNDHAVAISRQLRDDPEWRLDYLSNMSGVDWPETTTVEKTKTRELIDGVEREIERAIEHRQPGFLEAIYHLYSMQLRHGPVILRLRTRDRSGGNHVPSLTPVWRGAELQEREAFDLFGIVFDGHPDLRRILMWEGFQDFPMRKDYCEPDDYEYEPTPHDEVLERAKRHRQDA